MCSLPFPSGPPGLGVALVAFLVAACAVHEVDDQPAPPVPVPSAFPSVDPSIQEDGGDPQPPGPEAEPGAAWWLELGDARLDALVREALDANLSVASAVARVRGARALRRQVGALRRPQVDGILEASHERAPDGDRRDRLEAGLGASWELDLFERIGSSERAALLEARATQADLDALRLALSGDVADVYYEAVEQRLQLRLLEEQVELDGTLLELTELRFAQGEAAAVDVLQQRSQLAETRALVPPARQRLRAAENALDVLLGAPPDGEDRTELVEGDDFPALPATSPVGVPAALLERRPDLRARRDRLVAADHRLAAAIADRWPRVTLSGSLALVGGSEDEGLAWAVLAGLVQPLVDGGRRRAVVDERRAQHEALLAELGEAFLVAVLEVENLLYGERRQRELIVVLAQREALLTANVSEARFRYANGLTDYLPVLTAVGDLQETQRALLAARRELVALRVALHRSVGGAVDVPVDAAAEDEEVRP